MRTWSERLSLVLLLAAGVLMACAVAGALAGPADAWRLAAPGVWQSQLLLQAAVAGAVAVAALWPAARLAVVPAALLVKLSGLPLAWAAAPWLLALDVPALAALLAGGALHARAAWRQARWEAGPRRFVPEA